MQKMSSERGTEGTAQSMNNFERKEPHSQNHQDNAFGINTPFQRARQRGKSSQPEENEESTHFIPRNDGNTRSNQPPTQDHDGNIIPNQPPLQDYDDKNKIIPPIRQPLTQEHNESNFTRHNTVNQLPTRTVPNNTIVYSSNQMSSQEDKTRREKFLDSEYFKCGIIVFLVVLGVGIITAFVISQKHNHPPYMIPPPPQPMVQTSPPHYHHAFFHLKTKGYTVLNRATDLHWKNDESQNVGNIQLVNETYISVPQDGIYEINYVVQLYIPIDTPASVISLMLQKKNNEKDYVFMKKSSSSLDIPEHAMIQASFTYKFKANDTIFLKMNMAKLISPNTPSSYLSITSLHINNHQ